MLYFLPVFPAMQEKSFYKQHLGLSSRFNPQSYPQILWIRFLVLRRTGLAAEVG
jgi:hypothetical protein